MWANSEDGYLYAIDSSGNPAGRIFLQAALGAAYTPLSIGGDGRVYTQRTTVLCSRPVSRAARIPAPCKAGFVLLVRFLSFVRGAVALDGEVYRDADRFRFLNDRHRKHCVPRHRDGLAVVLAVKKRDTAICGALSLNSPGPCASMDVFTCGSGGEDRPGRAVQPRSAKSKPAPA